MDGYRGTSARSSGSLWHQASGRFPVPRILQGSDASGINGTVFSRTRCSVRLTTDAGPPPCPQQGGGPAREVNNYMIRSFTFGSSCFLVQHVHVRFHPRSSSFPYHTSQSLQPVLRQPYSFVALMSLRLQCFRSRSASLRPPSLRGPFRERMGAYASPLLTW